jgi:hypothetical protein
MNEPATAATQLRIDSFFSAVLIMASGSAGLASSVLRESAPTARFGSALISPWLN